ncbi:response regulator [Qingshengfaniella alkalisoli]|uniref:Response regulator n=1 Tax=Qingshengfaniella alkalisoli TaxID=2599296 RepID=A0A5B8IZ04_9RHOB|nr:response regulator [Qingshengfaniella alkalisoli]QDY69838.1 response regulator [Qingshengfaniella alkalisoli]
MSDSIDELITSPRPTAMRPLLGLTILLVEDSRFASEAIRLLCLRSGARIRRADCLASARRHLQTYRPAVVIVDLGLPDGSGADLIRELSRPGGRDHSPAIVATSGDDLAAHRALTVGAQAFLSKPVENLGVFQEAILRLLPEEARPRGPRMIDGDPVQPDELALHDDLAHVADLLNSKDAPQTLDYISQFLDGIARSAKDAGLTEVSATLARMRDDGTPPDQAFGKLRMAIQERLSQRAAI